MTGLHLWAAVMLFFYESMKEGRFFYAFTL